MQLHLDIDASTHTNCLIYF